jgi:ABC-2 type transport system ATP-binding protein
VNAIEVKGLRKSYGDFDAVRGINFSVPTGKVFAFLGPNGAGKTTTTEILEGYRDRTEGTVEVLGVDPQSGGRALRQRVGIVLQECGFPRFATVRELVELQAKYYPHPRSASETIDLVGLSDKRDANIRTLSGGQQRRLDLALAIVGDPDLIFLDEPTTGFDPNARREAWDTISNLRSLGKTIFLTTHYMDEAQYLADHIAVIARGEIVAEGPPESLGGRDTARTRITFTLPAGTVAGALPDLSGDDVTYNGDVVTVLTDHTTATTHRLTQWAIDRNSELIGLTIAQPTLEDVYLELTGSTR